MSPTPRALRVGVLLGDNLVEERVFRQPATVTLGQSLRCTLSVPADGVPMEHLLFAVEQGQLTLRTTPTMVGRVVQGNREIDVHGQAMPIEHGARGKLRIGAATVLFQEIAAPAIVPRMQLPASVRGTLGDRIDRRLGAIIAASLVVHLGIATWAWLTDRETDSMAEEVAAKYEAPRYEVIDMPDFAMPPVPPGEPGPGVATLANPATQTPSTRPRAITARMPEPVDANAWAQMLTTGTPKPGGQAELPSRIPGTDLDKQIQNLHDRGREPTDGSRPTTRDPGMRIGDGPAGPIIQQPGNVEQLAKQEKPPITRITPIPQPKPPGKDPLSINLVLGRIQSAYLAGLQRCYVKHGLSSDASMVAKVTLSFTVDETGMATDHQATGANPDVDSCIRGQMAGWKFQTPKDADGDPTEAPFKLILALQPS